MRDSMLQEKQEGLATLAAMGRNEDSYLAHVAKDEMLIPAQVLRDNPLLKTYVLNSISKYGVDPNKYIVGNGDMDLNPLTGLPEFGFLSKVFKKIKKVVKKVAPVAGALLVPGVGGALGAGLSKVGTALGIPSGIGSSVLGGKGILDRAAAIRGGIGGFFNRGKTTDPESGMDFNLGRRILGKGRTPDFLKAGEDILKGQIMAGTPGQSQIGMIEDTLRGRPSDPVRQGQQSGIGGLFGSLAGGNLTIPALYGLASYYGAKRDEGGLAATPATTMDQLGRYQIAQNLGTGGSREDFGLLPAPKALQFAVGGEAVKELDMRQGGESAGPGTGTSDDIPAMLSDGEFVMTAKATRGAGAYNVKTSKGGIELVKTSSPSREAGVKNMRKLMKTFEAI
jgi:hypothetical protein